MRPLSFLLFLCFSSTFSFTTTFSSSEECAACLFATHLVNRGAHNASGLFSTCERIEGCNLAMEHCEILAALPDLPPKGTSKMIDSLHVTLGSAKNLCEQDPKRAVLFDQSFLCTVCSLVENILGFFNDSVLGSKFANNLKNVLANVCRSFAEFIRQFCTKMFHGGVYDSIFQGLRDSLGPFYDILGVQGLGCPPIGQLQEVCFAN
ncbi:hypothetical protein L596_028207 [Steinernema carpocapsae]|uniref:Saposin B-type domain-containing protein n=1 Tax=Steinernema carpocapsae TaxID=34508 RepID=A0A4U5LXT2_STECR|nr:hypothetical protein L596_028207 [Steinernema carpocapsae]